VTQGILKIKTISRFGRNTVDSLETISRLAEMNRRSNIEISFVKTKRKGSHYGSKRDINNKCIKKTQTCIGCDEKDEKSRVVHCHEFRRIYRR